VLEECGEYLKTIIPANSSIFGSLERILPTIAQRKCLGIRKEEDSKEALYCWEIENFNLLEVQSIKEVKMRREQRRIYGQKVQKLNKWICSINEVRLYRND